MRTVLAALDDSPTARVVLEVAEAFAQLTDAPVEAVHVRDGGAETPEWLASHHHLTLRALPGPVPSTLLAAVEDDAVVAGVFGARGMPGGRRPAGHTAMHVLQRATKPIVVVPPDVELGARRPMARLLVPLEGDLASSEPVLATLGPLITQPVELVVLHVFTPATVPRVLDHPARDLDLWGEEFVARHCPAAGRIELRTGAVGAAVAQVAIEETADLIVLSWSRDSSPGHAAVIQEVLGSARAPVLLLPTDGVSERPR
jgi:nucleotide-binding universal stress UspA family protein